MIPAAQILLRTFWHIELLKDSGIGLEHLRKVAGEEAA
jgi:hypothetical protein